MNIDDWRHLHPEVFFLSASETAPLTDYLSKSQILFPEEFVLSTEKAGDGNMNQTVRVTTTHRSLILKQSRPWVEKYPQFEAPWDRARREWEFYQLIQQSPPLRQSMPKLLHGDAISRILVLEDLGKGADYSNLYSGAILNEPDADALTDYLSLLHQVSLDWSNHLGLANPEMRALNNQHIFFIPLVRENGLDLSAISQDLAQSALQLQNDPVYVQTVHSLSQHYLQNGPHLQHGDFFPGSFLQTPHGPRIIDPEFAFFGPSEFDGAVFLAHLCLARQPLALLHRFLKRYQPPQGHSQTILLQLAGIEIMRRLIGYAQLPLGYGGKERAALLLFSRQLVLTPTLSTLSTLSKLPNQPQP